MSFSSEIKEEVKTKYFTLKNRHSKIYRDKEHSAEKEYLMEMFLKTGTVSNPEKFYHLEFACDRDETADKIIQCMTAFDIKAKKTVRKSLFIVYLKDSEQISSLLALMGAHNAVLEFENTLILKEMRENIQRQVNCETANIKKTVSASVKQIEDIELIDSVNGLSSLPKQLQEAAYLRLKYPEATLNELVEICEDRIGRSGMNHRLRKISQIASEIKCGGTP